ncbi:hypothetical protein ABPG74_020246 [Tetrahymena malaccensis]
MEAIYNQNFKRNPLHEYPGKDETIDFTIIYLNNNPKKKKQDLMRNAQQHNEVEDENTYQECYTQIPIQEYPGKLETIELDFLQGNMESDDQQQNELNSDNRSQNSQNLSKQKKIQIDIQDRTSIIKNEDLKQNSQEKTQKYFKR